MCSVPLSVLAWRFRCFWRSDCSADAGADPGDVNDWTGSNESISGGAYMLVAALKSLGKPADQNTSRCGRPRFMSKFGSPC